MGVEKKVFTKTKHLEFFKINNYSCHKLMTPTTMTSGTLMCVLQHTAGYRCVNATPCQKFWLKFQMPTALGYRIRDNIFYDSVTFKITVKIQLG